MFGFTIAHVRGDSMSPRLTDGQLKLFRRRGAYRVGDIVLATHPNYGLIIKQISALEDKLVALRGLSSESVSETSLGQISIENIHGRLIG